MIMISLTEKIIVPTKEDKEKCYLNPTDTGKYKISEILIDSSSIAMIKGYDKEYKDFDIKGKTRIWMKSGIHFLVVETAKEIKNLIEPNKRQTMIELTEYKFGISAEVKTKLLVDPLDVSSVGDYDGTYKMTRISLKNGETYLVVESIEKVQELIKDNK